MSNGGSIVVRRSLGRRLKQLRTAAGKTWRDVDEAHVASRAKLDRIENGRTRVSVGDVRALCWLYNVDSSVVEQLVEQAINTGGPSWWEDYGDALPAWFAMYVELESAAAELLTWQPLLVPGLLQTPAYQRAVFSAYPETAPDQAERQIRLRSERQRAVLNRTSPLNLTAIIDAGALTREVGGPEVMHEQREHLTKMSTLDHVTVVVLPWSAGAHVAMQGAFNVLGFDSQDDPDVVYLETEVGGRYVEQPPVVAQYRTMLDALRRTSIPIEEYRP